MNSTTYYTIRFNERDSNRGKREYRMFRDSFVDEFSITTIVTIFLPLFHPSKIVTTFIREIILLFFITSLHAMLNLSSDNCLSHLFKKKSHEWYCKFIKLIVDWYCVT